MIVCNGPHQSAALIAPVFAVNLELRWAAIPKQMKAIGTPDCSWQSQPFINRQRFFHILFGAWRMHPFPVQRPCKHQVKTVEKLANSLLVDFAAVENTCEVAAGSKQTEDAEHFDL